MGFHVFHLMLLILTKICRQVLFLAKIGEINKYLTCGTFVSLEDKSININWSETMLRTIVTEMLKHTFCVRNPFCVSLTVFDASKRKERHAYSSALVYSGNNCLLPNTSK
jgi:hypothetical protein